MQNAQLDREKTHGYTDSTRVERKMEWVNSIPMNLAQFLPEHMTMGIPTASVKKTNDTALPGKILVLEIGGSPLEIFYIGKPLPIEGTLSCKDPLGNELFDKSVGETFLACNPEGKKKKPIQISIKSITSPTSEYLQKLVTSSKTSGPVMEIYPYKPVPQS